MVSRKREPFHSLLAAEKGREVSSPGAHAEAPGPERGRPHSQEVGGVQAGGSPLQGHGAKMIREVGKRLSPDYKSWFKGLRFIPLSTCLFPLY